MEWLSQNWAFVLILVVFVAAHFFGHGGHGGHGGGGSAHEGHGSPGANGKQAHRH